MILHLALHPTPPPDDDPVARQPVKVSSAGQRDGEQLSELHAASFLRGWSAAEFARLVVEPNVIIDRAMVGARLAGFVMSRAAADEAEVLSIAVASPYRRRGIARMLIATSMRRLAAAGVRALFLEVDERNASARRLYAASGFREVARRKGYYAEADREPGSALVLRRDLADFDAPDCSRLGDSVT
jgi:[ribosomal protein S18]-alanine N-acetyltransferase